MNLKAIGARIKTAREAKHLTQEQLAEMLDLSSTHISVIERGVKEPKLDTFVRIANALDVSADSLLLDVVDHAAQGTACELSELLSERPLDEQRRIIQAVRVLVSGK